MKRTPNTNTFPKLRPTHTVNSAILLISMACLLLPTSRAFGQQDGLDAQSVTRVIEVTAEILQEAEYVIVESENPRARVVLKRAVELHEHSVVLLDDRKFVQARQLSVRARSGARHAVKIARESFGFEEQARAKLERFKEYHDRLADRVRDTDDSQALHFLVEARRQARIAHEQFQQHNFQMVLSLIEPAEAMLKRVARLLFESGDPERLEHEFERTRALLDRVRESDANQQNTGSEDLMERAEAAFTKARQFQSQGMPLRALQSLRLARRLAGQVSGHDVRDNLDGEAIRIQIERFEQRSEALAEVIGESDSVRARQIYQQAIDQRDQAERLLISEDLKGALRHIKIAHDLLNEAGELAR